MSERNRTTRNTSGRPASARPASGRTAPSQSANRGSYTGAARPLKRKGRRKKTLFGLDLETLVALALILVVLAAIITLSVIGIKGLIKKNTKVANYEVSANISPVQTPVPEGYENTPEPTQSAVGQPDDPAVTPTPTPYVSSVSGLRSARIRTVGDFVMDKNILDSGKSYASANNYKYPYNFSGMLSYISSAMQNADFTVANVDGSMGGKSHYKYGYSGYPQFNTPEYLMLDLVDCGVDMLTLANNHMLDGWFDGLMDEIAKCEKAGLKHVGANRSAQEKATPVIFEINNIKVGFMNYTVSLNSMETAKGLDSRALEFGVNAVRNSNAAKDAKALREAGADVIVCYMHWGKEYYSTPDDDQKSLARNLVKAGVDIIVGGHPHVVQKAEWLSGTNQFGEPQKTLCVYSLGNFLSEHDWVKNKDGERVACNGGIIFDFTIQEKADGSFEIMAPEYLPVYVWQTGGSYVVLNAAAYVQNGTKPNGMTSSQYQEMVDSYNFQVKVMSAGVGTLINK
ncbi:MAG: CapA family protein [Clostridia bacterium]|nr:CapA family protein [Clostridia bacterium]